MSQERLPFTATYFGSIVLTLYFAVGVSSPFLLKVRLLFGSLGCIRHTTIPTTANHDQVFLRQQYLCYADATSIMRLNYCLLEALACYPSRPCYPPAPHAASPSLPIRVPYLTHSTLLCEPRSTNQCRALTIPATVYSSRVTWALVIETTFR